MTRTPEQAQTIATIFDLSSEESLWLQVVPYKGSLPTPVPTDPLICRWYDIVSVYGSTINELIHKEFGDGNMSASPTPRTTGCGWCCRASFLPYKPY